MKSKNNNCVLCGEDVGKYIICENTPAQIKPVCETCYQTIKSEFKNDVNNNLNKIIDDASREASSWPDWMKSGDVRAR